MTVSSDSLQYESGFLGSVSAKSPSFTTAIGMLESEAMSMSYITGILTSRVYDVAIESPLQFAPKLSERLGVDLWLKREDMQPVIIDICVIYQLLYDLCSLIIPGNGISID